MLKLYIEIGSTEGVTGENRGKAGAQGRIWKKLGKIGEKERVKKISA